ncbi:MAG: SUMF1/EgtB/PvdO family nonheme iron enzyme, partial [Chloroflexota bacterium]
GGRYLAEENSHDEQGVFLSAHLADDHWAEPARLAAGYLAIAGERRANDFLKLLAGLGVSPAECASALALAGLALSDLPADRVLPDTRQSLAPAMLEAFTANPPTVEPTLRRPLGLALGAVGDPRFSPTLISGMKVIVPEPVRISSGPFLMGTSDEESERLKAQNAESWDDEKPQHTVSVSEFAIGKYPITNAEYRRFWEAKRYKNKDYWSDDGWRWRTGQLEADLSIYSEEYRKQVAEWLAGRPAEKRNQPFFWDDPTWNAPNLPVVGVTWYEAEAYCKWLRAMTGEQYRLPTEAEWEKSARGPQNSLWPWGDAWDPNKCNSDESKFGGTTPVGMYPDGTYPDGPLDMVGNVWEWCADWFDSKTYANREGQETQDPPGPASGATRGVRGGAWY